MGRFLFTDEVFTCPECGSHEVFEHHQKYAGNYEGGNHHWTTKKERDADPELQALVDRTNLSPLVWVHDPTWLTCTGCKRDLSQEEIDTLWAIFNRTREEKDVPKGQLGFKIWETIGSCIYNVDAVKSVKIEKKEE